MLWSPIRHLSVSLCVRAHVAYLHTKHSPTGFPTTSSCYWFNVVNVSYRIKIL